MKFGDIILAVAALEVIGVLIAFVLSAVLIYLISLNGLNVASIVGVLISGLLVGYIFAIKIQEESRALTVGKIAVLEAFVAAFMVMISFPTNPYYAAWMKDSLQSMLNTTSWVTNDWFAYYQLALIMLVALNVGLTLVIGFVSIYAGSMLRKPKKV
jgi:hypothetical protein